VFSHSYTTSPADTYTLSLHDALPILGELLRRRHDDDLRARQQLAERDRDVARSGRHVDDEQVDLSPVDIGEELLERAVEHRPARSEEHTSELQSHLNLVCRLLLEKKK